MLSLYIHVPFCVQKCSYCGFYSTQYSHTSAEQFVSALEQEAALSQLLVDHRTFDSVYIGGGTPTTLHPDQLERLFRTARSFSVARDAEFTVEANPDSLSKDHLRIMLNHDVTRLSLGIQAFSDPVLRFLGRPHSSEQGKAAFRMARDAGFANVGIDLIYGIPGQTVVQWEECIEQAVSLRPQHVSAYSLSLDEGSRFTNDADAGRFFLQDDDHTAFLYERAVLLLAQAGYARYEISNFSLPGFESRHNMNYWERGEYLGLGPGAWSFLGGRRTATIADIVDYARIISLGRPAVDAAEDIGIESAARETILLGLRTMRGLDLERFEREFGPELRRRLDANVNAVHKAGLCLQSGGRLRLTERGILLSNEALARLAV